jgi:hypothetical protein
MIKLSGLKNIGEFLKLSKSLNGERKMKEVFQRLPLWNDFKWVSSPTLSMHLLSHYVTDP